MKVIVADILRNKYALIGGGVIGLLFVAFHLGYVMHEAIPQKNECPARYPLLRHDLDCNAMDPANAPKSELENEIKDYVDQATARGDAKRISVRFRDLNLNKAFGINSDEQFSPASLIKLPIAIAYFKMAEIDPEILNKKVIYTLNGEDLDAPETFKPLSRMEKGKSYTIEMLIERMLMYSDNDALYILTQNIDPEFVKKVLADLGVSIPVSKEATQDFLSARTYGSMLRRLYDVSYLSPDYSQKILDIMIRATFENGLKSGIPQGVLLANKFGERSNPNAEMPGGKEIELHDCGIIYKPDHPYVLCVMTEGSDSVSLQRIIGDISSKVYQSLNGY